MTRITSLIVGPGAIGALTCAHLQSFSEVYVYPHRTPLLLASKLLSANSKINLNWTLTLPKQTSPDIIWVTCKAHHVVAALRPLLTRYPKAFAVLLHNGMGPQQELQLEFNDRIIFGSTTCGALPLEPHSFLQTSHGDTYLGFSATNKEQQRLKTILLNSTNNSGALALRETDNIEQILWQKILINACINPLTAYHNIQNGEICKPYYRDELELICTEINHIMLAASLKPIKNPVDQVLKVATLSASNWSSMAMDVKSGRSTEIEAINGFLLKQAQALNIAVPVLSKWYKRIAFKVDS